MMLLSTFVADSKKWRFIAKAPEYARQRSDLELLTSCGD
jgi:hypothetical protein